MVMSSGTKMVGHLSSPLLHENGGGTEGSLGTKMVELKVNEIRVAAPGGCGCRLSMKEGVTLGTEKGGGKCENG